MTRSGFCLENMDEVSSRGLSLGTACSYSLTCNPVSDSSLAPNFWPKNYALFHMTPPPGPRGLLQHLCSDMLKPPKMEPSPRGKPYWSKLKVTVF